MSLPHLQPGEATELLAASTEQTAMSVALFKGKQLEVVRFHMKAQQRLPKHSVAGEITIQCLQGVVAVSHGADLQHATELCAGNLLFLSGSEPHALVAQTDCVFVVTIALKN